MSSTLHWAADRDAELVQERRHFDYVKNNSTRMRSILSWGTNEEDKPNPAAATTAEPTEADHEADHSNDTRASENEQGNAKKSGGMCGSSCCRCSDCKCNSSSTEPGVDTAGCCTTKQQDQPQSAPPATRAAKPKKEQRAKKPRGSTHRNLIQRQIDLAEKEQEKQQQQREEPQYLQLIAKAPEIDVEQLQNAAVERREKAIDRRNRKAHERRCRQRWNGTTRGKANSWMAFVTGKPPFGSFGVGNRHTPGPTMGGNYMVSHNIAPETFPNQPNTPQVYETVRRVIRTLEHAGLAPHLWGRDPSTGQPGSVAPATAAPPARTARTARASSSPRPQGRRRAYPHMPPDSPAQARSKYGTEDAGRQAALRSHPLDRVSRSVDTQRSRRSRMKDRGRPSTAAILPAASWGAESLRARARARSSKGRSGSATRLQSKERSERYHRDLVHLGFTESHPGFSEHVAKGRPYVAENYRTNSMPSATSGASAGYFEQL